MESHANHRQQEILDLLRNAGGASRISAIAQELNVTEETVRRNIKGLSIDGIVEKVHGGVRLLAEDQEAAFHQRLAVNADAKKRIAKHVAGMIKNGSSLFLDIGSTTAYIADALRNHQDLLIVTNSISVAYKLAMRGGNRVFMAGGELRSHDGGVFGADAMAFATNFQTEYAIMSSVGINAENGFMLYDLEEAKFSRLIVKNAQTCIVAADASKFEQAAPITVGDPAMVSCLVCDETPPSSMLDAAGNWDIEIQVAR